MLNRLGQTYLQYVFIYDRLLVDVGPSAAAADFQEVHVRP